MHEVHSKLMKLPVVNDFDMDENLDSKINSKYYDISELRHVYNSKVLSFCFIPTLEANQSILMSSMEILLRSTKTPFDIIGVSETKEQVDRVF